MVHIDKLLKIFVLRPACEESYLLVGYFGIVLFVAQHCNTLCAWPPLQFESLCERALVVRQCLLTAQQH